MKRIIRWDRVSMCVVILVVLFCGVAYGVQYVNESDRSNYEPIVLIHYVSSGDTVWDISKRYLPENRYILEFQQGIIEENWDSVFSKRGGMGKSAMLLPGDELKIVVGWKKKNII